MDAPPIPRSAVWLARAHLLLALVGLAAGGAAAMVLRAELWSPERGASLEGYGNWLGVHGGSLLFVAMLPAVVGVLGNVAVPEALGVRRLPTIALGWIAWATWAWGTITMAIGLATADGWTFYDPAGPPAWIRRAYVLVLVSLVLDAVHLAVVMIMGLRRGTAIGRVVAAGIVLPLVGQCVWLANDPLVWSGFNVPDVFATPSLAGVVQLEVLMALAVLTHLATRGGAVSTASAGVLGAALGLVAMWMFAILRTGTVVAGLAAKITLVLLWLRGSGWRGAQWLFVVLGVAPALLAWSAAQRVLARPDMDVHLHDTYFVVGVFHLEAAVIVSTLWAGIVAWAQPLLGRSFHVRTVQVAAALVAAGTFAHAGAMLVLGARGMPRRYVEYPDLFTPWQRVASTAGFTVAVGVVLLVIAWIVGQRRESSAQT